jgi:hypothetical protein
LPTKVAAGADATARRTASAAFIVGASLETLESGQVPSGFYIIAGLSIRAGEQEMNLPVERAGSRNGERSLTFGGSFGELALLKQQASTLMMSIARLRIDFGDVCQVNSNSPAMPLVQRGKKSFLRMKPKNAHQVMTTWPDCETRATNGPGRERRTLQIRGSAARKTVAISMPRRLPAVSTKTLALLALSAAISSGRYLSL